MIDARLTTMTAAFKAKFPSISTNPENRAVIAAHPFGLAKASNTPPVNDGRFCYWVFSTNGGAVAMR